jgi:hypothetical protein
VVEGIGTNLNKRVAIELLKFRMPEGLQVESLVSATTSRLL